VTVATAGRSATASAAWELWSTTAHLLVTEPGTLPAAVDLVRAHLGEIGTACSRFRPDSELSRINAAAMSGPVDREVSPLLGLLLRAALDVARRTDGDVDPTVGAALAGLGYDREYLLIAPDGRSVRPTAPRVRWDAVRLQGDTLHVPAGVVLDLGATAKAVAADRAAALVADHLATGVLVNLGGDLATAGPAPVGGWQVEVRDREDDPSTHVSVPSAAGLATSSTRSRTWRRGGLTLHHIVDPRTGASAEPAWRSVTVAAPSCVEANALSTAAIVRGRDAFAWLRGLGAPARLVPVDGGVRVTPAWPGDAR
jgi:thiamine biosynthesis lipoprotein